MWGQRFMSLQSLNSRDLFHQEEVRSRGTESYCDSTTLCRSMRENGEQPPLMRPLASELPNKTEVVGALGCVRNLLLELLC